MEAHPVCSLVEAGPAGHRALAVHLSSVSDQYFHRLLVTPVHCYRNREHPSPSKQLSLIIAWMSKTCGPTCKEGTGQVMGFQVDVSGDFKEQLDWANVTIFGSKIKGRFRVVCQRVDVVTGIHGICWWDEMIKNSVWIFWQESCATVHDGWSQKHHVRK